MSDQTFTQAAFILIIVINIVGVTWSIIEFRRMERKHKAFMAESEAFLRRIGGSRGHH